MSRNRVSTCLLAIGVFILAAGFIMGIIVAVDVYGSFMYALYWWLSAIVSGFFFIGLAEIVNLLQKLLDKGSNTHPAQTKPVIQTQKSLATSEVEPEAANELEEILFKDLTIVMDEDVRLKGQFCMTKSDLKVMKKSMLQSDTEAELVKVIPIDNLSADFEKNKDYIIFTFTEGDTIHKLAFKTHNIYDYERIVRLIIQNKSN